MNPSLPYVLAFDAESNGLHGDPFAVGAVLLDPSGAEVDRFYGRTLLPDGEEVHAWVRENVFPALDPETHAEPRAMRDAFWAWLRGHVETARSLSQRLVVAVDCGWPVEARLLAECVADDPADRGGKGPYPLHEVATLLLAAGMDPLGSYAPLVLSPLELQTHRAHHPVDDARVSARLARHALAMVAAKREDRPWPFAPGVIARVAESCARAAHAVNAVYCRAIGDTPSPAFDDLTDAQREGAVRGAAHALDGGSPADSHALWMASRIAEGWTLGPVKDFEAKTHPCLVPYAELPEAQRRKDAQFQAVVRAHARALA